MSSHGQSWQQELGWPLREHRRPAGGGRRRGSVPAPRTTAEQPRYGNVSTADFIAAAETASGMDLDNFFNVWLFTPGKPTTW